MKLINKNKFQTLTENDFNQAELLFQQGKKLEEVLHYLETWEKSNLLLEYFDSCLK